MGSDFVEQYRKKSLLSLLLLLFRGRAKYVTMAFLLAAASLPLVLTDSMVNGLLELPPVAAAFRAMGIGGAISPRDPRDSGKLVRTAIEESSRSSYWNRMLAALDTKSPCGAGCGKSSSLAMLKGDIYRQSGRSGKDRASQARIAGALSPSDAGYETGAVDFGNMPQGGGAAGGTPYFKKSAFSGPSGTIARGDSMYASAMREGDSGVPVPGRPQRVGVGTTGRAPGLSWREMKNYTRSAAVGKRPGNKRPMSQLAEAFSVTKSASRSVKPESQAGYTGAAYDGNDVDADMLTAANEPVISGSGFVADLGGAEDRQKLASQCAKAQSLNGARMSEIGKEMDDIQAGMTDPPSCSGDIETWNQKVARLRQLCLEFNRNQPQLSRSCQTAIAGQMGCGIYENDTDNDGLIIRKCSKPFSFIAMIFAVPAALTSAVFARPR